MLKAVDFFCGAGGVSCGFKQANIEILGGIDIDPKCKKTYEKNIKAPYLNIDISNYPVKKLGKALGFKKNQNDLIFVACSPCQYYSNITSNKSKSIKTRYLLSDFQEFVLYYKPAYVFIENVPGIENKIGSPLKKFKKILRKNGYNFDEEKLNAKNYGVPQNRLRYVLIASRVKNIKINRKSLKTHVTVQKAIGDTQVFSPIKHSNKDITDFQHTTAFITEININRLKHTPINGGDKRSWPKKIMLKSSKNYEGHYDVYGRMFWDKPSPTITTKFRSISNGRFGHPEQNRAISLREGATLQSFPLKFTFYSSSEVAIARMIGNAVPPKMAKTIGEMF